MFKHFFLLSLFLILWFEVSMAHDYIPGEAQSHPILLQGGDLHTVSHGVLKETDILFEQGRITQIGKNLKLPPHTEIIPIHGKQVYPGLIDPASTLGLIEIGAIRATADTYEVGNITPEVQTHIAYNPDSEIIPTIRSNGITTILSVPHGNLINGRSSLLQLDAWTKEDAMEKLNVALHLTWPNVKIERHWWVEKSEEEQIKENNKNLTQLYQAFDEAKQYFKAKNSTSSLLKKDLRWEAMLPVFTQELPVFIYANDLRQIEQALRFAEEYQLKMVLAGGRDAWKMAKELKEKNIPIILRKIKSSPSHEDDDYDISYRTPKLLQEAGVKFCLSYSSSGQSTWDSAWNVRNLPFMAGYAVAFGLSKEEALRSITLSTAEILGVEKDLGSLEVGKKATLVVSNGDLLDPITHQVTLEFIQGRRVNLDNKQKELYRKYQAKPSHK